ncbi:MAG: hypothetical protein F6K39_11000 [Okeania sp. SIO3B3]|nr:hypothetical protein [Okeania sp. SIO3B3]
MIGSWKSNAENSWLINNSLQSTSKRTQYINSLYWAITSLTTVGYRDITPATEIEIIFTE